MNYRNEYNEYGSHNGCNRKSRYYNIDIITRGYMHVAIMSVLAYFVVSQVSDENKFFPEEVVCTIYSRFYTFNAIV